MGQANHPAWDSLPDCRLRARSSAPVGAVRIALVNNMPDRAMLNAERQFTGLVAEAAARSGVRAEVLLFSLSEITRSENMIRIVGERYCRLDTLPRCGVDAVIVTGAEPVAEDLRQEPYWQALTLLLEWAEAHCFSVMLSCLAAHAAVLHFDGIERSPLERKCSGVFELQRLGEHALLSGLPKRWRAVHSRRNGVSETALLAHGYDVLSRSSEIGPDIFLRQGRSLIVGLQGHPEYASDTLLSEYRRDVARYVRGECACAGQDGFPDVPQAYFDDATVERFAAFRRLVDNDGGETMAAFPREVGLRAAESAWRSVAVRLFGNWLRTIRARKLGAGAGAGRIGVAPL